jgi:hypothetical protein
VRRPAPPLPDLSRVAGDEDPGRATSRLRHGCTRQRDKDENENQSSP